jgi:hypothetical protein
MTTTVFTDTVGTTPGTTIVASWLNDTNTVVYTTVPANTAAIAAHLADTTDAHAASAITNTPAGNIAATTVQAAINELDTEKAAVAQTMYIGTTSVAINRASSAIVLTGITSIDGNAATATTATNLSGTPTLPNGTLATTQAITDSSAKLATTNFVKGLFTPITNSLSGDVTLNNTSLYFDGPSIAQGTSGTWFVTAQIDVLGSVNTTFYAKLWDGTTLISSGAFPTNTSSFQRTITLSGYITNPVANLKISIRDATGTSGAIRYNTSGLSKDSYITAFRIG